MTLSIADKVLKSATCVSESGTKSFSGPDLVASAWENYPEDFGLPGRDSTHPDTCKVIFALIGKDGLVEQGFVRSIEARQFVVTDAGKDYIADLFNEPALATGLTKKHRDLLVRLLNTKAFAKVESGQKDRVFKSELEEFYGIAGVVGGAVDAMIESVFFELTIIESKLGDKGKIEIDGHTVNAGTARLVRNIGDLILSLHERHLDKIRKGI